MTKLLRGISLAVFVLVTGQAGAVELLTNGNLEAGAGGLPGWTLNEFITGGGTIDAAEQVGFADRGTGEFGIFLKPFAGGDAPPGQLVNAVLSQSVPATAGVGYSFSGWSRWEGNYAGGVTTLDSMSPFGAIPSPTRTELSLEFLNSAGTVIGTPRVLDLRTQQNNFDNWFQHNFDTTFGGGSPLVAPAGTASIRVSASMIDGAFNVDPSQAAFFDDISLRAANNPGVELLNNGNFDTAPPEFAGFDVIESPDGVDTVNAQSAPWAQNSNTPGSIGAFLHPWANMGLVANPNDATLSQTVDGVPGGNYTFRVWSKFEQNYSGGVNTLAATSPNGAVPSPTQTTMELAFLDMSGMPIDTPLTLDIRANRAAQSGNANDNIWRQHSLSGVAPMGTASVRVSASMIDGVFNRDPGQSAFFDDFSLDGPGAGIACDFNGDNACNGADADLLVAAIAGGTNPSTFDLTGDGSVDLDDRDQWLTDAGAMNIGPGRAYLLGDANLDGTVDGQDFISWNSNKFMNLAAWTKGDFTADGVVDGQDFITWNTNKFQSADGAAAVPEASASVLLLLGCLLGAMRRTR